MLWRYSMLRSEKDNTEVRFDAALSSLALEEQLCAVSQAREAAEIHYRTLANLSEAAVGALLQLFSRIWV